MFGFDDAWVEKKYKQFFKIFEKWRKSHCIVDEREQGKNLLGLLVCLNHGIQSQCIDFRNVKLAASSAASKILPTQKYSLGSLHAKSDTIFSLIPVNYHSEIEGRLETAYSAYSLRCKNSILVIESIDDDDRRLSFESGRTKIDSKEVILYFFLWIPNSDRDIYTILYRGDDSPIVAPPSGSTKRIFLKNWHESLNCIRGENERWNDTSFELIESSEKKYEPIMIELVSGLIVVNDFISKNEECGILCELLEYETFWNKLSRREILHFNRRFIYGINAVGNIGENVATPNPSFYNPIVNRLRYGTRKQTVSNENWPIEEDYECDQLTLNKYTYTKSNSSFSGRRDKSGIAEHVDAHKPFGDYIFVISLESHTVMEFRNKESEELHNILLLPRSLLILSGEARYLWTHKISEKKMDFIDETIPLVTRGTRISLTFRKTRQLNKGISKYYKYDKTSEKLHEKSRCLFPSMCDGD